MFNKNEYINKVCSNLDISINDYKLLRNRATRLHSLFVKNCNGFTDFFGHYSEIEQDKGEQKIERAIERIKKQVNELGLYFYIQPDPRGETLYLYNKELNNTNYDKGYCIL